MPMSHPMRVLNISFHLCKKRSCQTACATIRAFFQRRKIVTSLSWKEFLWTGTYDRLSRLKLPHLLYHFIAPVPFHLVLWENGKCSLLSRAHFAIQEVRICGAIMRPLKYFVGNVCELYLLPLFLSSGAVLQRLERPCNLFTKSCKKWISVSWLITCSTRQLFQVFHWWNYLEHCCAIFCAVESTPQRLLLALHILKAACHWLQAAQLLQRRRLRSLVLQPATSVSWLWPAWWLVRPVSLLETVPLIIACFRPNYLIKLEIYVVEQKRTASNVSECLPKVFAESFVFPGNLSNQNGHRSNYIYRCLVQ